MIVSVGCAVGKARSRKPIAVSPARIEAPCDDSAALVEQRDTEAHGPASHEFELDPTGGDQIRALPKPETEVRANQVPITVVSHVKRFPDVAPLSPRTARAIPSNFRELSESEMLCIALANSPVIRSLGVRILDNPSAAATAYDPAITMADPLLGVDAALSEFDTVLSTRFNSQVNDRVFNNATLGGDIQELVQDTFSVNSGLQKRNLMGTVWELNGITGHDNNNRLGNIFPNFWETQLEAGVRQPLLRGAGRRFNEIAGPNARPGFNFSNGIVIAKINNRVSEADFKIQLRNFVRDLHALYWELDRQYQTYDDVGSATDLARATWESIRAKSDAKLAGGEAHREAQARARYYRLKRQEQTTLGGGDGASGLYATERRLRNMMGLPAVDDTLLRPVTPPAAAEIVFDYDTLVAQAVASRTEIYRQQLRVNQQELRLVAARNFLLPQMDVIGRYRLRGFGDDLAGGGPRFSSAYQDFFSMDHQEWEFGLEMGVVAGRRQAKAAVRHAKLQLCRERSLLDELERALELEVSDAYADVASSYAALESVREQVSASKERLASSMALYDVDRIRIEFLIDAQEDLLRAQRQLAIDQARYATALVSLNASTGALLQDLGIEILCSRCRSEVVFVEDR